MNLSNAPDAVLEALATAALLRHPLGPLVCAIQLAAGAEAELHPDEARRWNRAIEKSLRALQPHPS